MDGPAGPDGSVDLDDSGRALGVAALVAALRSRDPATIAQALDRVSALGTAVIPKLLAALKVEHDTQAASTSARRWRGWA
ncbi:MAG TPA: hypothetical protein VID72_10475 [Ktedonobacterales bacterium]|jgi:hypothetical protein